MLRITLVRNGEPLVLKLEGRLVGPWIQELERSWNEIRREGVTPSVVVDLSDLTFLSPEGKQLLKTMFEQGANLQSRSLMTRFIIGQIKKPANGKPKHGNGG
jgi:anti-anti-sigma regulatory factor